MTTENSGHNAAANIFLHSSGGGSRMLTVGSAVSQRENGDDFLSRQNIPPAPIRVGVAVDPPQIIASYGYADWDDSLEYRDGVHGQCDARDNN